jgi:hypothetical protein
VHTVTNIYIFGFLVHFVRLGSTKQDVNAAAVKELKQILRYGGGASQLKCKLQNS